MKKILFLFMAYICLLCLELQAQVETSRKITLSLRNEFMSTVFKRIENVTGVKILFSADDIKAYKVTVNLKNATAEQAVKAVIDGFPMKYKFKDGSIIITVNKTNIPIKWDVVRGIVRDREHKPMIGVVVSVPGTSVGTVSDVNGEFALDLKGVKVEAIQVSYVGMKTEVIPAAKLQKNMVIVMREDFQHLDDVIVIGYQTVSKERATGAFGSMRKEQLNSKLNANLNNLLEGQVAGVVLDRNGNPSIRGISTLNAETAPLVVVDGYPTESSLSDLNPENIDNITILKDGVAASIYGSRSANGVIVVTTKQGKAGKPSISYRTTFKFEPKPDLDYLHIANTSDYIDAELTLYELNPSSPIYNISYQTNNQSRVGYLITQKQAGMISESQFNSQIEKLRGINALKEMEKHMFRTALTQTHNMSINGGNDVNRYNLAVNYTNNRAAFINTHDNRLLIDLKNDWTPYKFLAVGITANINYTRETSPRTDWANLANMSSFFKPYTLLVDENGWTDVNTVSYARQKLYEKHSGLQDYSYNPIRDANEDYRKNRNFSARLGGFLRFDIGNGLTAEVGGNWSRSNGIWKQISSANSYKMRLAFNNGTSIATPATHYIPYGDMIDETRSEREDWTFRMQANYRRAFGKHRITALVGNEMRRVMFDNNTYATRLGYNSTAGTFTPMNIRDFNAEKYDSDMLGGRDLMLSEGSYDLRDNRFVSWYFNGSYEFDNRYLISGSIREDLTNFFGTDPKYRYRPMWSIGGTWKLQNENFFPADWVDRMNIRASYGINGNISLSEGPYLILYSDSFDSTTEGISYGISSYPNNALRWEKTATTNIGLDMDVLENRFGFSFDYYFKKSTDLLAPDAIDPTTGTLFMTKNVGAINNTGYELSLYGIPVKTKEFMWNVVYNLAFNKNEVVQYNVTRLYPIQYAWMDLINEVGYPMNSIWGYRFAGLDNTGSVRIYKGDGTIGLASAATTEDVCFQGTVMPKCEMSLTNSLSYKNWNLSFMFIAKLGHKYRKDCFSGTNYDNRYVSKRWRKPGDENNTIYPALNIWNMDAYYFPFCDVNVGNASYAKLRDVILNYTFDKSLISRLGMSDMRIYLQVRNLFRITAKDCDIDPETMGANTNYGTTSLSNSSYSALPLNKECYIGVSFTF